MRDTAVHDGARDPDLRAGLSDAGGAQALGTHRVHGFGFGGRLL